MYHHCHLLSQTLLQHATARILLVFFDESVNHILFQRGEYLDILLGIVVADIEPELIELIRCGALGVEPDVSRLGLTKLLTIALGNQRTCQGKGLILVTQRTTNELSTRGDITPLVVTA